MKFLLLSILSLICVCSHATTLDQKLLAEAAILNSTVPINGISTRELLKRVYANKTFTREEITFLLEYISDKDIKSVRVSKEGVITLSTTPSNPYWNKSDSEVAKLQAEARQKETTALLNIIKAQSSPGQRLQTVSCELKDLQLYSTALPLNARIISVLPFEYSGTNALSLNGEYGTAKGNNQSTLTKVKIVYELPAIDAMTLNQIPIEKN